jgi:hypothetical protein
MIKSSRWKRWIDASRKGVRLRDYDMREHSSSAGKNKEGNMKTNNNAEERKMKGGDHKLSNPNEYKIREIFNQ